MKFHCTKCSNTSTKVFVFTDFPGNKKWTGKKVKVFFFPRKFSHSLWIVGEMWTPWLPQTVQLIVQDVETKDAHLWNCDFVHGLAIGVTIAGSILIVVV